MKRTATAVWNGTIKEGNGKLGTASGVLSETPYSFNSRFGDGTDTNPEELIAAAHAGCFSMKLSGVLTEAGFTPESIETTCTIEMKDLAITTAHLKVKASIPGIDEAKFQECATDAKENCPVSKALNLDISMDAELA
ncbi:MAG: OsmC family protein [Solitalea sp.]